MVNATAAEPKPHTLDDVMMAMDVVDTLRHREDLVRRELDETGREAELIARLKEIYRDQGIEVPDRVLEQGVKALKESRFTYVPQPPSWKRTLLGLWARRGTVARRAGLAILAALVLWGVYYFAIARPAEEARRSTLIETTEALPKAIRLAHADVQAVAAEAAPRQKADALLEDGERAIRDADLAAMRRIRAALVQLRDELAMEYTLTIVSAPGETTGVWRRPPGWLQSRNYYLIVEAVTADGRKLPLPIRNEETGETKTVGTFGVRVPQETYAAVAQDKRDDGIVQKNRFGVKRRGRLSVDYLMPFDGGAITDWQ
ncbi:MAG: hypothetical protein KJZ80_12445 [Hyphomicrobiaceae bacterium]|nr:hypothetical protein [Hyphomicrobiaceae bacterium]